MRLINRISLATVAACIFTPFVMSAQAIGPSAYLGFFDSPFSGLSGFSYFYNENFEDHLLDVPGVSASAGGPTSIVFGPSIHDSVDEDDGVLDGSGLNGDSFFSNDAATGIRFTFNALTLGVLPTHVGLVWTDGVNPIFFEAFDGNGNSLGTLNGNHANGSFNGETSDDFFYGMVSSGGIGSIFIRSGAGGIEIDHLQYGARAQVTTVPEPVTLLLTGAGLFCVGVLRLKRRPH